MSANPNMLLRYTDLTALFDILENRRIALLDHRSWDDKNDTNYLEIYKERRKLSTLLALCLTETGETFHHWRVFSNGSSGVCIVFRKEELKQVFSGTPAIRMGRVKYKEIEQLRQDRPVTQQLPFIKRYPYRDEKEFRIIYGSEEPDLPVKHFPISLSCIRRIVLSSDLHPELTNTVKKTIRRFRGCGKLEVTRTTLLNNPQWLKLAQEYANV